MPARYGAPGSGRVGRSTYAESRIGRASGLVSIPGDRTGRGPLPERTTDPRVESSQTRAAAGPAEMADGTTANACRASTS